MSPISWLWLAWAVAWAWMARSAKPVARREGLASQAAHLVPLALTGLLLSASPESLRRDGLGWLARPLLAWQPGFATAGTLMVAAGLVLAVWARLHLAGEWSGTITLKQGHRLVRTGPYRRVRHPIYTGLLLALLGTAVAVDAWRGVAALALAGLAVGRKVAVEERFMGAAFGAEYAAYRRESGTLLPW